MAHTAKVASWQAIQKKTFTRWANQYLKGEQIDDLTYDLSDGIKLAHLINAISEDKIGRINEKPKFDIHKLDNLNTCIKFLENHDLQLVNIGSSDILNGNEKLVLGLIWTIILRFEVADAEGKQGLLLWVQRSTKGYAGVNVTNFTSSFKDGLAFNALIHRYRPDLLEFNSLSGDGAVENCENAFNIAEKDLGIARLLDAEDVVDVPDEKSIVAYVSQFFKKFAGEAKYEAMSTAIKNAVEVSKRHDDWILQYNEGTREALSFAEENKKKFTTVDQSSTTEEVGNALDSFTAFVKEVKPTVQAKRAECDGVYAALVSSKRNNKRPEFVPTDGGCLPQVVAAAWDEMEALEQAYERKLLDKYLSFQRADRKVAKFNTKASTLDSWFDDQLKLFSAEVTAHSVQELEAQLELQRGFENRIGLYKMTMTELLTIKNEVEAAALSGHAGAQSVATEYDSLEKKMTETVERESEYRQKLESALSEEQMLVALEKEYIMKVDKCEFNLNELLDKVTTFDSVGVSVSDIQMMLEEIKKMPDDVNSCETMVSELTSLSKSISKKQPDAESHVLSLQQRLESVSTVLADKESVLGNALKDEERKDVLKQEFAKQANDFHSYCSEKGKGLSEVSGELEAQLQQVNSARDAVVAQGKAKLDKLNDSSKECDAAHIVVNSYTPHTMNSLTAQFDQLLKSFKLTANSLEAQIVAKKALEVSPEQLLELKEVFGVFDSDHDGTLTPQEFKEAILGIGIDISSEELEKRTGRKTELTMEDFVQFFIQENKSGDSKEDIINAFKNLGGGETISQDALNKFFAPYPEVKQFMESNIVDGNYLSFIEELFTR
mmetsp:Transcript_15850/g.19242  ORF Transcript_15850/g.19242 Transcript_15850/m.19242 type:complete len:834 (+) Transcript_15850:150-2651(+)